MTRLYQNVFRAWSLVTAAVFALMLLHQSDSGGVLGRYSVTYAGALAVVGLVGLLALTGWWLARRHRLPDIRLTHSRLQIAAVLLLSLLLIAVFWVFLPAANQLPAIALFRVYVVALIAGLTLLYLALLRDTRLNMLSGRVRAGLLLSGLLVALLLQIIYLGEIPASLHFDEPLIANYGWTCTERGYPGLQMHPGLDSPALSLVLPLSFCLPGLSMQILGSTLEAARLPGLLLGWLSVPFVMLTAQRLYGRSGAMVAGVAMALLPLTHNYVRGDPYVMFALSVALYGYTRGLESSASLWWHALTGFMLATTIEGHQLGVRFIPVFGALYLWRFYRVLQQRGAFVLWRPVVAFAAGGFFYAGMFLVLRVFVIAQTDLSGALTMIQTYYAREQLIGGDLGTLQRLYEVFVYWFVEYVARHPVDVLLLAAGVWSAFRRSTRPNNLLLLLLFGSWLVYWFITPKASFYYWVQHLPLLALLLAGFVQYLTRYHVLMPVYVLLAMMVLFSSQVIYTASHSPDADGWIAIGHEINRTLPPDVEPVTGHQVYFFGLSERVFYDLNTYANLPVPEASQRWNLQPPQAVILNPIFDDPVNVKQYIESQNMQRVRCYGRTELYVLPRYAAAIPVTGCTAP